VLNRLLRRRPHPRLDPVLLRPPATATLLRGGLVAALLALAAMVLWGHPADVRPAGRPVPASPLPGAPAADPSAAGSSGRGRLPVPAGLVGVPVRLTDPATAAVLQPGDRIDLLALRGGAATAMATNVLVLDVATADDGPVLYLALGDPQARAVAAVEPAVHFGVIVHPR
jgi:hypothetical protein